MRVELVYISDDVEFIREIDVSEDTTVESVIQKSSLLTQCPEVSLKTNSVGIFGKVVPLNTVPQDGDRIEVYRSLLIDPKEARRLRAEKNTGSF